MCYARWKPLLSMYWRHRTRTTAQGTRNIDGENPHQATHSSNSDESKPWSPHPQIPTWNCLSIFFLLFSGQHVLGHTRKDEHPIPWGCVSEMATISLGNIWSLDWIYIDHKLVYRWNAEQLLAEWLECLATLPLTILFFGLPDSGSVVYCVLTDLLNKHLVWWYDLALDIPVCHLHHLGSSSQQNIPRRLVI